MSNVIKIFDRIKQLSQTTSTNDIELSDSSVDGFSKFSSVYNHDDVLFYAITDGSDYEIGSGVFKNKDESAVDIYNYDTILRYPISSSNGNNKVSFNTGTKEVFATYPATHAVYQGSGAGLATPQRGGVAFWDSSNVLNYSSDLYWDVNNSLLGIQNTSPSYAIDIAGTGDATSSIRASGFYVGSTGVYFAPRDSYVGGTQVNHFTPNQLNTETGSDLILELSGVVSQHILLTKQAGNTIFAGPTSGCEACPDGYPTFRNLVVDDIPDLSGLYGGSSLINAVSGYAVSYTDTEIAALSGHFDTNNAAALETAINDFLASGTTQLTAQSGEFDNFLISAQGDLDNENKDRYVSVIGSVGAASQNINLSSKSKFPFTVIEEDSEASASFDTTNYYYTVPYSGKYFVSVNLYGLYDTGYTPNRPEFYIVSSGASNSVLSSGNPYSLFLANNGDSGSASRSYIVNVASGDTLWVEASGKFYNFSSLTINKI